MAAPKLFSRISIAYATSQKSSVFFKTQRYYNLLPLCYDKEDPAPLFFSSRIQDLLKYLTRPNPEKIFRKRTYHHDKILDTPQYKFLTDAQLKEEIEKARQRAEELLRMPPVIKIHQEVEKVISNDPAIKDFSTAKYVITDITYGLNKSNRTVVIRETNGKLKHADNETKKRIIQTYFPLKYRCLKEPAMFTDEKLFNSLLEKKEYLFVLDRACIQYDPEEHTFQKVFAQVFQHCDLNMEYEIIRSTRHFGPMAFYLAWHNVIDNLMLDILKTGFVREAIALINLQRTIHTGLFKDDETTVLIDDIIKSTKLLGEKDEKLTDADIDLDEKCFASVHNYINKNSSKKGAQELELQHLRSIYKNRIAMERGIEAAHGKIN